MTFTEEKWLPVAEFGGKYEVSDMGRVRSLRRWLDHEKKVLNIKPGTNGYWYARLYIDNKLHMRSVAALVLTAFVGSRPPGLQAAHLDGNRANNRRDNLAWVTRSENEAHKRAHGTYVSAILKQAKLSPEQVVEIVHRVRAGVPRKILMADYNVSRSRIISIMAGESWGWLTKDLLDA